MSDVSSPQSEPRLQYLLVRTTKETMEYDPDQALDAWREIVRLVPENDNRGYTEGDWLNDEGRVILLHELLEGSILGDMIFGSLADQDAGSELERRWDDE